MTSRTRSKPMRFKYRFFSASTLMSSPWMDWA